MLTVAKFQGGGAFNVIPDSVTIAGTFRAFSMETLLHLKQRIEEVKVNASTHLRQTIVSCSETSSDFTQVIVGQAAVQRCNATVKFNSVDKPIYPPTVNNRNLHLLFERVAGDMLGAGGVKDVQPMMGAEDFSFYQELIPGYFFMLGMKDETLKEPAPVQSSYFRINEDALPVGAALHASLAIRFLLENPEASPAHGKHLHDEL